MFSMAPSNKLLRSIMNRFIQNSSTGVKKIHARSASCPNRYNLIYEKKTLNSASLFTMIFLYAYVLNGHLSRVQ